MTPEELGQFVYDRVIKNKAVVDKLPNEKRSRIYEIVFDKYVAPKTGITGEDAKKARDQFVERMSGRPSLPISPKEYTSKELPDNIAQRHPTAAMALAKAGTVVPSMLENTTNLAAGAVPSAVNAIGNVIRKIPPSLPPKDIWPTKPEEQLGTKLFGGPRKGVEESKEIQEQVAKHPYIATGAELAAIAATPGLSEIGLSRTGAEGRSLSGLVDRMTPGPGASIIEKIGSRVLGKAPLEAIPFTEKKEDLAKQTGMFAAGGAALGKIVERFKKPEIEVPLIPKDWKPPGRITKADKLLQGLTQIEQSQSPAMKNVVVTTKFVHEGMDETLTRRAVEELDKEKVIPKDPIAFREAIRERAKAIVDREATSSTPIATEEPRAKMPTKAQRIKEIKGILKRLDKAKEKLALTPEEANFLARSKATEPAKDIKTVVDKIKEPVDDLKIKRIQDAELRTKTKPEGPEDQLKTNRVKVISQVKRQTVGYQGIKQTVGKFPGRDKAVELLKPKNLSLSDISKQSSLSEGMLLKIAKKEGITGYDKIPSDQVPKD